MNRTLNFLEKNGLKWVNHQGQDTLWEVFRKESEREVFRQMEDIEQIETLLSQKGSLIIKDPEVFSEKYMQRNELMDLPKDLFQFIKIRPYIEREENYDEEEGYEDEGEWRKWACAMIDYQASKDFILSGEIIDKFLPDYQLQKVFHPEKTEDKLRKLIDSTIYLKADLITRRLEDEGEEMFDDLIDHCYAQRDPEKIGY